MIAIIKPRDKGVIWMHFAFGVGELHDPLDDVVAQFASRAPPTARQQAALGIEERQRSTSRISKFLSRGPRGRCRQRVEGRRTALEMWKTSTGARGIYFDGHLIV